MAWRRLRDGTNHEELATLPQPAARVIISPTRRGPAWRGQALLGVARQGVAGHGGAGRGTAWRG